MIRFLLLHFWIIIETRSFISIVPSIFKKKENTKWNVNLIIIHLYFTSITVVKLLSFYLWECKMSRIIAVKWYSFISMFGCLEFVGSDIEYIFISIQLKTLSKYSMQNWHSFIFICNVKTKEQIKVKYYYYCYMIT